VFCEEVGFLSLLAHGPPRGIEYLRIGGSDVWGFFLFLIAFQIELSSLLRLETEVVKDALPISYITGCICYSFENFGLGSLHDDCVGLAAATPRFYSVGPKMFDYRILD